MTRQRSMRSMARSLSCLSLFTLGMMFRGCSHRTKSCSSLKEECSE